MIKKVYWNLLRLFEEIFNKIRERVNGYLFSDIK